MAYMMLKRLKELNGQTLTNTNIESLLSDATFTGISHYSSVNLDPSVKAHMTVEEFLTQTIELSNQLEKIDGPNQALLTDSNSFHNMFTQMISAAYTKLSSSSTNNSSSSIPTPTNNVNIKYLSIIITKPPETIAVFLPILPKIIDNTNNITMFFFDSHSRPELDIHGSYILKCYSLQEVIQIIKKKFPPLESNAEDENYMTWMYNSFECTAFILSNPSDKDFNDYVIV